MEKKKSTKVTQLFNIFSVQSKDEDIILMQKLQGNDFHSFERLYMKYRAPLYSYFLAQAASPELAEELLQDTFTRLLDKRHSFHFESKFSTWLWTISRNIFIDNCRSNNHHIGQMEVKTNLLDEDILNTLDANLETAEEVLIKKVDEKNLQECINELATNQKEALLLRTYSDLSYDEIAKSLEVSISSVKSLLVRAKDKLLKCLKDGGHCEK